MAPSPSPITAATSRLLAAALIGLVAGPAVAGVVPHGFSTTGAPYGSPGVIDLFSAGDTVSGTFQYDAALPPSGTLSNGATRYDATFLNLSGQVKVWTFSDPRGYTAVGNDLPAQGNNDFLMLGAEPGLGSGTHNLVGFTAAGWTLVNVRLFWIEGLPGIGDFTTTDAMPAVLPGFAGRLALDFVPVDAPTGPVSYVFFDGLTVAVVPEPSPALLLAAGLGVMWLRRRQAVGGSASSAS